MSRSTFDRINARITIFIMLTHFILYKGRYCWYPMRTCRVAGENETESYSRPPHVFSYLDVGWLNTFSSWNPVMCHPPTSLARTRLFIISVYDIFGKVSFIFLMDILYRRNGGGVVEYRSKSLNTRTTLIIIWVLEWGGSTREYIFFFFVNEPLSERLTTTTRTRKSSV